jgi:hypothetical protein
MRPKPSVGVILIRAEWFDSVVALPELVETTPMRYRLMI